MLVSHAKKFIYLKTIKTAGTSVEGYFEKYCTDEDPWVLKHERDEYESPIGIVGHRGENPPMGLKYPAHLSANGLREKVSEAVWNSYFKFCVVRNPWDRAISMFYWRNQLLNNKVQSDVIQQFENWLIDGNFQNDYTIYSCNGEFAMDKVIRYEELNNGIEEVCSRLKIPFNPNEIQRFKSEYRPKEAICKKMYTQRGKSIIRATSLFEIYKFGYDFPKD